MKVDILIIASLTDIFTKINALFIDTEPPKVVDLSCPDQAITLMTASFPFTLQWEEPKFADNVQVTEVTRDGEPGMMIYTWGDVAVRYIAFDAANNMAECTVVLSIIQRELYYKPNL